MFLWQSFSYPARISEARWPKLIYGCAHVETEPVAIIYEKLGVGYCPLLITGLRARVPSTALFRSALQYADMLGDADQLE